MDITFENVSYTYQPNTPFEHQALKNISFHIPSGTFVAIIGHTGSGKSTLIQHLNGLVRPTEGKISIGKYEFSHDKKLKEMKELRQRVGVVFQYPEHQLFDETVEKDIAFGPKNFGVSNAEVSKRIEEILPKVGLATEILERSPLELSGGQMRRVAIAGVLAAKPSIYVLDEPTAGLDPKGQKEILDMFHDIHHNERTTTILVTHSMENALTYADHIIILNKGEKFLEGKPEEILTNENKLHEVQLLVPESLQFIKKFNEKFVANLPLTNQTSKEIATKVCAHLKGK